jgi:hypothetical protein
VSFVLAPAAGRQAAPTVRIPDGHALPHNAAARGLEVSLRHLAQLLLLQRQSCHQPFQPAVLFFQFLQPLRLVQLQPSEFLPTPTVGLFTDTCLPGLLAPRSCPSLSPLQSSEVSSQSAPA